MTGPLAVILQAEEEVCSCLENAEEGLSVAECCGYRELDDEVEPYAIYEDPWLDDESW